MNSKDTKHGQIVGNTACQLSAGDDKGNRKNQQEEQLAFGIWQDKLRSWMNAVQSAHCFAGCQQPAASNIDETINRPINQTVQHFD